VPYGWEYSGIRDRLVVTPLTVRVLLALTHAAAAGAGGTLTDPADTGTTETVKELGDALGRRVVVLNCDASFDDRAVGRNFAGVARTGTLACFE